MLDKLKQWTLRVFDWNSAENGGSCHEEALESLFKNLHKWHLDPRELPRPPRSLYSGGDADYSQGDVGDTEVNCSCRNCTHLSTHLMECAICMEPLFSTSRKGITSCRECGNIACVACAGRLPRCPYCRTDDGLMPNIALQRLIHRLHIPCRKSVLPVRCPRSSCKWRGDIDSLSSHLEKAHLLTILNGSSMTLDIAEFQRKVEISETRPRHYSVLLRCFTDVFVCKVTLHNSKLKVVLSQLTSGRHKQLAAWVEITYFSKTVKGIIRLSKNKSDIQVPVSNFVAPVRGTNDRVSISINIRPLS